MYKNTKKENEVKEEAVPVTNSSSTIDGTQKTVGGSISVGSNPSSNTRTAVRTSVRTGASTASSTRDAGNANIGVTKSPRTKSLSASSTGSENTKGKTSNSLDKTLLSEISPYKKTKSEIQTESRIAKMDKIVTKDTNDIDNIPLEVIIDHSVFLENENEYEEDYSSFVSRSKTIDGSLLSQDQMKKSKKAKRKIVANTNFALAKRYNPDSTSGLSTAEIEERIAGGYVNITEKKKGKSFASIFLTNIFTFFNILIFTVAAALIATQAPISQLFFLIIIFLNIAIGITLEIKSKITVDKLSLISAPTAIVIRNGERKVIPISEVVLDDIIFLETGKQICADAIVIKGEIEVNESMLTGESENVKKIVDGELFSGSFVTSGNCFARVDKVGAANYVENLSSYAKRYKKPNSELQNAIKLIMKIASIIIIPVTVMMLYGNANKMGVTWTAWQQNISKVSGAVIGMLPAGMFLLTSIALAMSVIRLAGKKTLVQDLYCIEMLARVDVLCLDKTGTITDGSMQVNNVIEIKGGESQYSFQDIIGSILTATGDNNQTSMALANYFGYSKALKATSVIPFSSKRKLSAVSFEGLGTYMIGAPEFVLRDVGVRIDKIISDNAANGYRVLCLAHAQSEIIDEKLPVVRRPICLIVIEDHIRDDAHETIRWFKENSVSVKVISGDNPITVSEVAKRVGVERAEMYISLVGLSNQEVIEAANKYTVFGRVTPEQKMLLIKAIKSQGHTVAMTGDGVNDILAMREADCSISIASGSEAARNVSHLVLLDSNFTSMPDVVKEGRRVINNIQKSSSLFLMKTFMSVILAIVFLFMPYVTKATFTEYPFSTNNFLLFEMCVIGLPSFVLALQKNESLIKGKFLSNVVGRSLPSGITLAVAVILIFYYLNYLVLDPNIILSAEALKVAQSHYTTLLVLCLTYTGFILLIKICEPLDLIRTILIIGVATLTLVGVFVMPESIFGISRELMNLQDILFLVVVVLASYFFVSILVKILRAVKMVT